MKKLCYCEIEAKHNPNFKTFPCGCSGYPEEYKGNYEEYKRLRKEKKEREDVPSGTTWVDEHGVRWRKG